MKTCHEPRPVAKPCGRGGDFRLFSRKVLTEPGDSCRILAWLKRTLFRMRRSPRSRSRRLLILSGTILGWCSFLLGIAFRFWRFSLVGRILWRMAFGSMAYRTGLDALIWCAARIRSTPDLVAFGNWCLVTRWMRPRTIGFCWTYKLLVCKLFWKEGLYGQSEFCQQCFCVNLDCVFVLNSDGGHYFRGKGGCVFVGIRKLLTF